MEAVPTLLPPPVPSSSPGTHNTRRRGRDPVVGQTEGTPETYRLRGVGHISPTKSTDPECRVVRSEGPGVGPAREERWGKEKGG